MKYLASMANGLFTTFSPKGPERVEISAQTMRAPVSRIHGSEDVVTPLRNKWLVLGTLIKKTPNAGFNTARFDKLGDAVIAMADGIPTSDVSSVYAVERDQVRYVAANLGMIEKAIDHYSAALKYRTLPTSGKVEKMPANEIPLALGRFHNEFNRIMQEAKVEAPAQAPVQEGNPQQRGSAKGWCRGGFGAVWARR